MGDGHVKRLAAQIASQLPEDTQEALRVLNMAREIIVCLGRSWDVAPEWPSRLGGQAPTCPAGLRVVAREGQTYPPGKSNQG